MCGFFCFLIEKNKCIYLLRKSEKKLLGMRKEPEDIFLPATDVSFCSADPWEKWLLVWILPPFFKFPLKKNNNEHVIHSRRPSSLHPHSENRTVSISWGARRMTLLEWNPGPCTRGTRVHHGAYLLHANTDLEILKEPDGAGYSSHDRSPRVIQSQGDADSSSPSS